MHGSLIRFLESSDQSTVAEMSMWRVFNSLQAATKTGVLNDLDWKKTFRFKTAKEQIELDSQSIVNSVTNPLSE